MGEASQFYAWFIARDILGHRTEHVHFVEPDAATHGRLLFRDFLRSHKEEADRYETLKRSLLLDFPTDRAAYTLGKTDFVRSMITRAKQLGT